MLAVLVAIGGGLVALFVVLSALGAAGAASRFAPAGVTADVLGAGLLGGLFVALATILYALLLWAASQGIQLMLSIEGRARESTALQRAVLAEPRADRHILGRGRTAAFAVAWKSGAAQAHAGALEDNTPWRPPGLGGARRWLSVSRRICRLPAGSRQCDPAGTGSEART